MIRHNKHKKEIPGVGLLMAEILHQLIGSFSHYLQGFILYIPGGCLGFQPSTGGTGMSRVPEVNGSMVRKLVISPTYKWGILSPNISGT